MEILAFILVALAGFTVLDRKYWRRLRKSHRQASRYPTTVILPASSAVLIPLQSYNTKPRSS